MKLELRSCFLCAAERDAVLVTAKSTVQHCHRCRLCSWPRRRLTMTDRVVSVCHSAYGTTVCSRLDLNYGLRSLSAFIFICLDCCNSVLYGITDHLFHLVSDVSADYGRLTHLYVS